MISTTEFVVVIIVAAAAANVNVILMMQIKKTTANNVITLWRLISKLCISHELLDNIAPIFST